MQVPYYLISFASKEVLARKPIPTVQNTGPYNDALNSEGPIQLNPSLCHMPRVTHAFGGVMYLS